MHDNEAFNITDWQMSRLFLPSLAGLKIRFAVRNILNVSLFLLANDLLDPWDIKIHLLQSRFISLDEKILNHSHYSEISMGVLVTFLIVQDEAAPQ